MASSYDKGEMSAHAVTGYIFLDNKEEPVSFSVLPIQWSEEEDRPHSLPKEVFLEGLTVEGCLLFRKQVTAWKFQLREEEKYPDVSVLTEENSWVKILRPRKPYEDAARTILITLQVLHHIKKYPDTLGEPLWDQLLKIFRLRRLFRSDKVRPGIHDLLDHLPLISDLLERDENLSKSEFLTTLRENLEKMNIKEGGTRRVDVEEWVEESEDCFCLSESESAQWETVQEGYMSVIKSKNLCTLEKSVKFRSLAYEAATPGQHLQILMSLLKSQFETNATLQGHMAIEVWKDCIEILFRVTHVLQRNPNILMDITQEFVPEIKETKRGKNHNGEILIFRNLVPYIVRVYVEYNWILAATPRNENYVEGLKNESNLIILCKVVFCYFRRRKEFEKAKVVALLLVQLLCSKSNEGYNMIVTSARHLEVKIEDSDFPDTCNILLDEAVAFVDAYGNLNCRVRALLCRICHLAVIDDYEKAKTLMLGSYILKDTSKIEVLTQVLYNRVVVQLGLSAFRAGLVSESYDCLSELNTSGRIEELIGQAASGWHYGDNIPKQEHLEQRLQTPFHLQVSVELLDAVYLVCSMIIEVFSLPWPRHTESVFGVPSHRVDDRIYEAARALSRADFASCLGSIRSLQIWDLIGNRDCVLQTLEPRVKEASLRVYVSKGSVYRDRLSIAFLASNFELFQTQVLDMLKNGQLQGKLSEDEKEILF